MMTMTVSSDPLIHSSPAPPALHQNRTQNHPPSGNPPNIQTSAGGASHPVHPSAVVHPGHPASHVTTHHHHQQQQQLRHHPQSHPVTHPVTHPQSNMKATSPAVSLGNNLVGNVVVGSNGGGGGGGGSGPPLSPGVSPGGVGDSGSLMMMAAGKREIETSLHLIQDIRRLENYQRDYLLKVKESLNAVLNSLDRQLMDNASSNNLIECEETLLKTALQTSLGASSSNGGGTNPTSSKELRELYGNLLREREGLKGRFMELLTKTSLSEFVVNSGQILSIETVRAATDAIINHEKPIIPKHDKSVPIDHTFFLANYCITSSIAQGMMNPSLSSRSKYGTGLDPYPSQQQPSSSNKAAAEVEYMSTNGSANDISESLTATSHNKAKHPPPGIFYKNPSAVTATVVAASGASTRNPAIVNGGPSSSSSADFVPSNPAPAAGSASRSRSGGSNMFGKELVSAITQIALQDENTTTKSVGSTSTSKAKSDVIVSGNPGGKSSSSKASSSAVAVTGAPPPPPVNPWIKPQEDVGVGVVKDEEYYRSEFSGGASARVPTTDLSVANVSSDVTSDTVSNSSTEDKPLSFARIASLNLEKQAVVGAAAAAAAAAAIASPQQQAPTSSNRGGGMLPGLSGLPSNSNSLQILPSLTSSMDQQQRQVHHAAHVAALNAAQQQLQQRQQQHQVAAAAAVLNQLMPPALPPSNNPRFFLDIVMEGKKLGRVIIEVEPNLAPKMSQNFQMLVTGEKGFGYRGCQFFQAWKNESVICGDWEHNSGRGGRAALDNGNLFTPDDTKLPCIRGAVGMRRMSKKHSSLNQVASQFRIILANMHTQFSGIFGHIISGIEALDKVANVGGEGGRPEKIASVQNCGLYKQ